MSKRNRSSSTLPKATLDRARQQAEELYSDVEEAEEAAPVAVSAPRTQLSREERDRRRVDRARSARPGNTSGNKPKASSPRTPKTDQGRVAQLLANPTKTVTEQQLKEEYSYVLKDLRGTAILASVLLLSLVTLAVLRIV